MVNEREGSLLTTHLWVLEVLIEPNIAQQHAPHVERTAEKAVMLSVVRIHLIVEMI
jgi:hypothetical protein